MRIPRFVLVLLLAIPLVALAQTYVWVQPYSGDPLMTDYGEDGIWDTTTPNWATAVNGQTADNFGWPNGTATASFTNTKSSPHTVTLGSDITAGGIQSTGGFDNYSIVNGGAYTLTLAGTPVINIGAGRNFSIGVAVAGTAGFEKIGDGSVTLSAANTYTGVTKVTQGGVHVSHADGLGLSGVGNETRIEGGATVTIGLPTTFSENFILNGGSILYNSSPSSFSDATLTGPVLLTADSKLEGDSIHSSLLRVTGGISQSGSARNVFVDRGVTLSGVNTFTGTVTAGAKGGGLYVSTVNDNGMAGALGAGSGLRLGYYDGEDYAEGTLTYTGGTASSNRTIQIDGDTGFINVAALGTFLTLSGVISGSGGGADHDFEKTGPGRLILTGNNTYSGDTYLTSGMLTAGSNNAFGSGVYVQVGTVNTLASETLNLLLANGVTLTKDVDVTSANSSGYTTLGLYSTNATGTFAGAIDLGKTVYVSTSVTNTLNFTGNVSGNGAIIHDAGGVTNFTGGITLPLGGIDIQAGKVQLSGSVILGNTLHVQSGAKLTGNATIANSANFNTVVHVHSGGILSPGLPTGTLTVPALSLDSGSNLNWQLNSLTTSTLSQFGNVTVNTAGVGGGSLAISNTSTLTVDLSLLAISLRPDYVTPDIFWASEHIWKVVDFTGPGSNSLTPGTYAPMLIGNGAWGSGSFDTFVGGGSGAWAAFDSGDVYLRFSPVPEPSTYVLLGLGGALLGLRRRLRRS